MKRVGKWGLWVLGGLVVLAVIGALAGDPEEDKAKDEQAAKQTATETPTPTPTPTPKPEVTVAFGGPYQTTSDTATLHGQLPD